MDNDLLNELSDLGLPREAIDMIETTAMVAELLDRYDVDDITLILTAYLGDLSVELNTDIGVILNDIETKFEETQVKIKKIKEMNEQ